MGERRTGPKEVVLLKRWEDWSDGIGHLVDEPRVNGMYYSSGLLGLKRELRPAPFFNVVVSQVNNKAGGSVVMMWNPATSTNFAHCGVSFQPSSGDTTTPIGSASTGKISSNTVLTFSHTVGAGSNQCLVVGVSNTGGAEPTGVTYSGEAMTKVGDVSVGSTGTSSIWRKTGPATGANDVVVTFAGSVDIVAGADTINNVDQSNPTGLFVSVTAAATTDSTVLAVPSFPSGAVYDVLFRDAADSVEAATNVQTSLWNDTEGSTGGSGSVEFPGTEMFPSPLFQFQYFIEDQATSDGTQTYLYAVRGTEPAVGTTVFPSGGGNTVRSGYSVFAHKISSAISQSTPLKAQEDSHRIGDLLIAGQPARYQGLWHFPAGNDNKPRELTTIGAGDISTDTLTVAASSFVSGADHLANLSHQMIGVVKDGTNAGGARILIEDGDPQTNADWGSVFQVGDKNERPAGVQSLRGLSFVMHQEGLYSFNNKGRAGLIFEDYRLWRSPLSNIPLKPFREGLLIPHPAGLLYAVPGNPPIGIGLGTGEGTRAFPPSGPTELHGGRFHSISPLGDFVFAIYQPDITSTTVLVLVGVLTSDTPSFAWQSLGTATLNEKSTMLGCTVTTLSLDANGISTPFGWFGNAGDLNYIQFDPRGSPFRSRADTHKVNIAADAYMSEIIFPEPVDLTEIIIYTQDMADGDEWQLSAFYNDEDTEVNFGTPFIGNGKDERNLDLAKVTRFMLHVNWVATSTSDRVPPTIKKIELMGRSSGR